MNLTVLGAGAWGTAIATHVCRHHPTLLWTRDPTKAAHLKRTRTNPRYLPGIRLPNELQVDADFDAAVAHAAGGLVLIATPMAALRPMLMRLRGSGLGLLWLCKGFEQGTGRLGHEVAAEVAPSARVGVVSGPSFALEVARGQPTALVAASHDASLCAQAVTALHHGHLRVYTSDDPVGVEVGGAVKNVLAIASGIADGMQEDASGIADGMQEDASSIEGGMQEDASGIEGGTTHPAARIGLGQNARAALVTRGLAEMTRLGLALGARGDTFMGLSGLGDLLLTTTGDLSRNRQVGLQLAEGRALRDILTRLGHVAEGVPTAPMVLRRALACGVDMPIVQAVARVLAGDCTPRQALTYLMGRQSRPEVFF